jgi:hypothetical protein
MTTAAQLRLVIPAQAGAQAPSQDPTRRVFEHWLFMLGRSPARCKLGPVRRAAINVALTLYDEDVLLQAVEGIAADPLDDCSDKMRDAMRELEWLLAKESRVERWADLGERLRQRAARMQAAEASAPEPSADAPAPDPAAVAAARERLRRLAAHTSGRGG